MLLWALYPGNPYGYYIILRIIVCAICAYLAFQAFQIKAMGWVWVLGVLALIYNPILPFHMPREIWSALNIATIITLGISIVIFIKQVKSKESKGEQV